MEAKFVPIVGNSLIFIAVLYSYSLILSKGYSACFRLISDKIMHIKNILCIPVGLLSFDVLLCW